MSATLHGKIVVATAAGQGIGRAAAEAFDRAGAHVAATDLDEGKLGEIESGAALRRARLDVLDGAAVTGFFGEIGPVDVRLQREGRAEPLRLERHEGGGDRAHEVGRGR